MLNIYLAGKDAALKETCETEGFDVTCLPLLGTAFKFRVESLEKCDLVLAEISDGPLVWWELGAAYMAHKFILLFNLDDHYAVTSNPLLFGSTLGVVTSIPQLKEALKLIKNVQKEDDWPVALAKIQAEFKYGGENANS